MSSVLENFKKRRSAVPKWLSVLAVLFAFFFPIYLVIRENNLFDLILNWIITFTGPEANYIHLLSYLLCVVMLLFPAGLLLQLIGFIILKNKVK